MRKGFKNTKMNIATAVCAGLLMAQTCVVCRAGDFYDVNQLLENNVYIVGSIADNNELKQTLESLQLLGLTGTFVVTTEEMKRYPQNVQLITRQGHKIILQMGSKEQTKSQPAASVSQPAKNMPAALPQRNSLKKQIAEENTTVKMLDKLPEQMQTKPAVVTPISADREQRQPEKTKQALKAVDNQAADSKTASQPAARKQRLNRDFYGADEHGDKVPLRYPGTAKDISNVPEWSIASLAKLSDCGLLSPDDIRDILAEPDRELMAKMVARAYHVCAGSTENAEVDAELGRLLKEYDTELRNLGYGAFDYAAYAKLPQEKETKIGGEVRYNYVRHSQGYRQNARDSRLRLRVYAQQPLDENWTLYGMGEANKSWIDKSLRRFNLERLYIEGNYKEVDVKVGRFGEFYADGNIYDGHMTGASVSFGKAVKLQVDVGELRDGQKGGAVTVTYSEPRFDAEAGIYNFDNVKGYGNTTIGSLGGMYYLGNFGLGAMYLYSTAKDVSGASDGYIVSVKYGRNRSWVPGTYELFAKYYNQADSTYLAHTMVGLGDYMHGFKGYGAGMYYTLAENWLYGLEYYDLNSKENGRRGRTLWNHVSYFF